MEKPPVKIMQGHRLLTRSRSGTLQIIFMIGGLAATTLTKGAKWALVGELHIMCLLEFLPEMFNPEFSHEKAIKQIKNPEYGIFYRTTSLDSSKSSVQWKNKREGTVLIKRYLSCVYVILFKNVRICYRDKKASKEGREIKCKSKQFVRRG